ncbi:pitrilysin family protein [Tropicimonas sp. IMCC6043]|uniref:M16 family metallopeptidase n=1 Tax=Tropicimonas sp. IMCC6043 TaxID=2510645 RepID=UPI00101D66A4|nr:pitrilysin family protein [Tropicimonas sp. IMCC6043]RYH09656.1 insulinase family protein [Tropicimonas sp. IMCC6043]
MIRLVLAFTLALLASLPARAAVDIEEVTTPGGVDAWLVEEHSIPFLALELRFQGGASLDAPGKRGATNLMTALLEEGAGEMDATEFSIAAESLAAEFRFRVHDDALSVSAKVLSENRDEAMELLREALVSPRFDADAIERVRAQVLASIDSNSRDPDEIASETYNRLAFGDHPYGTSSDGTEESVAALTREDLVAAHDGVLARDRVFVAAVGDITAEELAGLLDRLLGDLPETGAPMPERIDYALDGGVTVVDFDTPQSVIIFGQRGMRRNDPDFFPAFVMTQILGGSGFSSRLMEEVREKRGLTYGIGAYLYPMDLAEMLTGMVSTVNDRAAETVAVVQEEWRRLAEEGVTEEELARAKTYLTGAYPLRFDGNGRIANILVGMQMDGLTTDYIRTRNDKIEAVTLEDIRRVANTLVDPDGLHFVVVGKPEGLSATN